MGRRAITIITAVILFSACSKQYIPRDEVMDILVEMYELDATIEVNHHLREACDTLLVYEAIFQKYGYSAQKFVSSLEHYLERPDKFRSTLYKIKSDLIEEKNRLSELNKDEIMLQLEIARLYNRLHDSVVSPQNRRRDAILNRILNAQQFLNDTIWNFGIDDSIPYRPKIKIDLFKYDTLAIFVNDLPASIAPLELTISRKNAKHIQARKDSLDKVLRDSLFKDSKDSLSKNVEPVIINKKGQIEEPFSYGSTSTGMEEQEVRSGRRVLRKKREKR